MWRMVPCEPSGQMSRLRFVRKVLAATVALVVMTTGAAACTHSKPSAVPTPSPQAVRLQDPVRMVGSWRVKATGEQHGSALLLGGGGGVRLFRRCGELIGQWAADRYGNFIGQVNGGQQPCFLGSHPDPHVPWIDAAVRYRIQGSSRL